MKLTRLCYCANRLHIDIAALIISIYHFREF
jgi:hypothetical protein